MKQVNTAFISYLTSALDGGADDDELIVKYFHTDSNDAGVMKNIILNILRPEFDSFPPLFKIKAKECLGFCLATGTVDLKRKFNGNLLPFDTPKDCRLFYLWIWEVFFPDENFDIYTTSNYIAMYNINEPLDLFQTNLNK